MNRAFLTTHMKSCKVGDKMTIQDQDMSIFEDIAKTLGYGVRSLFANNRFEIVSVPLEEKKVQSIVDWFDPMNLNHINAYKHLCQTGVMILPQGVDAETIDFGLNWQIEVMRKLSEAWVNNFHRMELYGSED